MPNSDNFNYIKVLDESLNKKISILKSIQEVNAVQSKLLSESELDYDKFDATVDEKAGYIDEIESLDKGFQSVYDRISEALVKDKALYSAQIKAMQEKIRLITDMSMDIQSSEARNKEAFGSRVVTARKSMKSAKTANRVAADYYQSMSGLNVVDSQFLDTKK